MLIGLILPLLGLLLSIWDADDIALEMPEHPNIWTDGSREDFSSVGGFEVAGAGAYVPAAEVALIIPFGVRLKSTAMLGLSVAVLFTSTWSPADSATC